MDDGMSNDELILGAMKLFRVNVAVVDAAAVVVAFAAVVEETGMTVLNSFAMANNGYPSGYFLCRRLLVMINDIQNAIVCCCTIFKHVFPPVKNVL